MLRVGTFFESRLGRADGNPTYVQACLKRMQYYGSVLKGLRPKNERLDPDEANKFGFAGPSLDPIAEQAAKDLFEKYGEVIEADHFYPTGELRPFGQYQLSLHVDWGEDGLKGILPYEPIDTPHPFAYWCSDSHINNGLPGDSYPYRLSVAKKADFVFCAQKRACEEMKRDGIENPIWLPHAVEPQAYPKFDLLSKKYDIGFVGHVNSKNREDALDRMFREFPNFYYGQQLFEAAARKYAESKIVFNISMADDLIMRCFECMGTGSFLLTNWIPTIEEHFEDGKHLVLYKTLDEAVDKAKYFLAHDEEREKIAQAGYEEVIKKHKIQDRVNVILNTFLESRKLVAV